MTPHDTPRPPLVDDGPRRVDTTTTYPMAAGLPPEHGVTVTSSYPQAGVHDGQDPPLDPALGPRPSPSHSAVFDHTSTHVGWARAGADDVPFEPDRPTFDALEQNGFNAVRSAMLGVVTALGALPPEAIDEAIAYAERARRRILARGNSDPRLREALKVVEEEARYLAFVQRARKDLVALQGRIEAAAVVTG